MLATIISAAIAIALATAGFIWRLSATLTRMDGKIDTGNQKADNIQRGVDIIMTNHLPHIERRLLSIEKYIREKEN